MIALIAAVLMTVSFCAAMPAQAKSKEKKEAKFSKNTIEADTYEEFSIRLKSSHEALYYYCDVEKLNEKTGNYDRVYSDRYQCYFEEEVKFSITFY